MYVKKLKIENFRGIRDMELELHRRMNVFIGVNGAGKSSVLDALGYLLTPPVLFFSGQSADMREFTSLLSDPNDFPDHEIHNGMQESNLKLTFAKYGIEDASWQLCSSNAQHESKEKIAERARFNIFDYSVWKSYFSYGDENNHNTSLIVYYRVRREVDNVSIEAWTNRNFRKMDAFVDALSPKVDFKEFFEWFRNREDLENEERAYEKKKQDSQLDAVREVISIFCGALENPRVRRRDPLRMVVTKNNQELRIEQLSEGEKCLLAMVGDLARRLAIANPSLDNPLHGEGVVLIDEVDLHLHPQWQRMILPRLMETFPNCQFIVSTHSPQIIGEIRSEHVFILSDGGDGIIAKRPAYEIYGQTSSVLLEDMMQTSERKETVKVDIRDAYEALAVGNIDEAKRRIGELREKSPDLPDLTRFDMRLSRKEVVGK